MGTRNSGNALDKKKWLEVSKEKMVIAESENVAGDPQELRGTCSGNLPQTTTVALPAEPRHSDED